MGMGSKPSGTMLAEINVTPLVDVMLVLLIIFMITAPLAQAGVQVQVPQASAPAMPKKEGVTRVRIAKNGAVYFGKKLMVRLDLRESLHEGANRSALNNITAAAKRDAQMQKTKEAYIDADTALNYGVVVNVMVKLQEAKVVKLGLVTQPPKVEAR